MLITIIKLGWKNVWRNPVRSAVVIIAVVIGTWAGIFSAGFFNGFMQDYLDNQIELTTGHIQIMHPQYEDLYAPEYTVPGSNEIIRFLKEDSNVTELIAFTRLTGLAQSTRNSYGVTITGLSEEYPDEFIATYLKEGSLINTPYRYPVMIGSGLAERLDLGMGSRMVLTFQDSTGDITGGAFRVAALFDSFNDRFDESHVFVPRSYLNELIGDPDAIHLIRIQTPALSTSELLAAELSDLFPMVQVKSWKELSPDLRYLFDMTDLTLYIVMIIIIIGLVFSIINTMLMAVLERSRELGMLRAVGMNRLRTFSMVMAETFFLTMAGAPIGLFLSWITISWFAYRGIDLSAFSEGLGDYGMSTMVYPELAGPVYLNLMLMIAAASLLSAVYPAIRALRLRPVEAIRKFN